MYVLRQFPFWQLTVRGTWKCIFMIHNSTFQSGINSKDTSGMTLLGIRLNYPFFVCVPAKVILFAITSRYKSTYRDNGYLLIIIYDLRSDSIFLKEHHEGAENNIKNKHRNHCDHIIWICLITSLNISSFVKFMI